MCNPTKACLLIAGLVLSTRADVLQLTNTITWQGNVGVTGGIPGVPGADNAALTVFASVTDAPYNAAGDGITDDTAAFAAAISDCPTNQVITIPAGTFLIGDLTINKGIVLRGAGMTNTLLLGGSILFRRLSNVGNSAFDNGNSHIIGITSAVEQGTSTLTLSNVNHLAVGTYVTIRGEDPDIADGNGYEGVNWCDFGPMMTQISRVTAINSTTITIDPPMYWRMPAGRCGTGLPEVHIHRNTGFATNENKIVHAGIEDLSLDNNGDTSAIEFQNCVDSWALRVEYYDWQRQGIYVLYSANVEIRGCTLRDSRGTGSGGGYGNLIEGSSRILIEDNIMKNCPQITFFDDGTVASVSAYNYVVTNNFFQSNWLIASSGTHSAHPMFNLFEGNHEPQICMDNVHGSASHMTMFRNRITGWFEGKTANTFPAQIDGYIYWCQWVGNILGTDDYPHTTYEKGPSYSPASGEAIYGLGYFNEDPPGHDAEVFTRTHRHWNWDSVTSTNGGIVLVDGFTTNAPASLYLAGKPLGMEAAPWPLIGPDVTTNPTAITNQLAYRRWNGLGTNYMGYSLVGSTRGNAHGYRANVGTVRSP